MQVSLQVPPTAQVQRPKACFYFHSHLQTVFSSPTVTDTSAVSTILTTRTTAKTYTLSIPSGANTIRVIVYGHVNGGTGYFVLSIDGVDVQSTSTTSFSEVIVMDYIGSISPGTRTIRIDYYISQTGFAVTVTKVYIITGIGLISTTQTDIRSFTLTYQILRQGDIRYSPGVRVFVFGNRKTTASTSLTLGLSGETIGRNNLSAGNDNDRVETILAIITGSTTLQEGGEFTINVTLRGNVGATGDIVIITSILARAQLRRETWGLGEVRVYERGVAEYFARAILVSVPGGTTSVNHHVSRRDIADRHLAWFTISGGGSDVTFYNFRVAVVAPVHFTSTQGDASGESFLEWVQVVVWG